MTEVPDYDERVLDLRSSPQPVLAGENADLHQALDGEDAGVPLIPPGLRFSSAARGTGGTAVRRARRLKGNKGRQPGKLRRAGASAPRSVNPVKIPTEAELLWWRQQHISSLLLTFEQAALPHSPSSLAQDVADAVLIRLRLMQYPSVNIAMARLARCRQQLTAEMAAADEPGRSHELLPPCDAIDHRLAELPDTERQRVIADGLRRVTDCIRRGELTRRVLTAEIRELGQEMLTGKELEYLSMRSNLLGAFGSLRRARRYFDQVTGQKFADISMFRAYERRVQTKRPGWRLAMHPNLFAALQKAEAYFDRKPGGTGRNLKLDFITFSIRANTNTPSELSPHSFGIAIDINAKINPNIKPEVLAGQGIIDVWTMVREITDIDPMASKRVSWFARDRPPKKPTEEEAQLLAQPVTNVDLEETANDLYEASQRLISFFRQPTSSAQKYLASKGLNLTEERVDALLRRYGWVTRRRRPAADEELARLLTVYAGGWRRSAPPSDPDAEKETVPTIVEALPEDPELRPVAQVFIDVAIAARLPIPAREKHVERVAVQKADIYYIITYGFMNIPTTLMEALTSKDGGNLKALGTTRSGVRDTMHFELKAEKREYSSGGDEPFTPLRQEDEQWDPSAKRHPYHERLSIEQVIKDLETDLPALPAEF